MKKAQVLLAVMLLLATVAFLVGALQVMIRAEIRTASLAEHSLQAFYAAQAGIEHAKVRADAGGSGQVWTSLSTNGRIRYDFTTDAVTNITANGSSRLPSGNSAGAVQILATCQNLNDGIATNNDTVFWRL